MSQVGWKHFKFTSLVYAKLKNFDFVAITLSPRLWNIHGNRIPTHKIFPHKSKN